MIINGDLDLDAVDQGALVVDGDLEVTGSILNADPDEGRSLVVHGSLRARNLITGGAAVRVDGDAAVEGLIFCYGGEQCPVIEGETQARLVVHGHDVRAGLPLSESLHRDVPVSRVEDEYPIAVEEVDPYVLIDRIRAGLPVLRDPDDPRPRKTYAQWLADCTRFGLAIRWVPRELLTDELVDAALAETAYAIQWVPVEFRTPARCRQAVQHRGNLLHVVPMELRTPELCALAIGRERRLSDVIPLIPEEHFTPELCLRAAKRDGLSVTGLPERFRTFDLWVAAATENPFVLPDVPESIRDEVRKAVVGPPVTLTLEERKLIERPSKLRLFLFFMKHFWRGIRSRPSAEAEAPRPD